MDKPFNQSEVEKVPCDVCRKEVPLSEAKISEAADYVAHFCGMECYAQWKKGSERARPQSGNEKNKP